MAEKSNLTDLPHRILEEAHNVGIESDEADRAGSLFHVDQSTVYSEVNELFKGEIEIMDTKKALEKYPWVEDYFWNLIDRDQDEYTEKVAEEFSGGYFMRIMEGADIDFPLQSCLLMTRENTQQRVHNIIIAEEGSQANILSGCAQDPRVGQGSHIGVTEYYVKKDASLNFTMIHDWGKNTEVRPRSAAVIGDGGEFVSNYLTFRTVKDLQMYPVAYCNGSGSRVSFNNILYGREGSRIDVGSKAVLNGDGSRGEMITRAIAQEESEIIARGLITGNDPNCKGHLECRGLMMGDKAKIRSIPELEANREGADITHEAAVGKLSEGEIEYLMTRGISRDQAVSLITRGFMDVDIMGLPEHLNEEVENILDLAIEGN